MKKTPFIIGVVLAAFISLPAFVLGWDDTKPATPVTLAPIQVKGDSATRIKDAYNALISANRELQYAILQARYDASVPKDFEFDLTNFTFNPPRPSTPSTTTAPTTSPHKETKP